MLRVHRLSIMLIVMACLMIHGQEEKTGDRKGTPGDSEEKTGKRKGTAGYKEGQLTGTVRIIDKEKSTITIMKGNVQGKVVYSSDTKWMYGTQCSVKPGSLNDLKENWYINCKGTFDGVKLVASACRFREEKSVHSCAKASSSRETVSLMSADRSR